MEQNRTERKWSQVLSYMYCTASICRLCTYDSNDYAKMLMADDILKPEYPLLGNPIDATKIRVDVCVNRMVKKKYARACVWQIPSQQRISKTCERLEQHKPSCLGVPPCLHHVGGLAKRGPRAAASLATVLRCMPRGDMARMSVGVIVLTGFLVSFSSVSGGDLVGCRSDRAPAKDAIANDALFSSPRPTLSKPLRVCSCAHEDANPCLLHLLLRSVGVLFAVWVLQSDLLHSFLVVRSCIPRRHQWKCRQQCSIQPVLQSCTCEDPTQSHHIATYTHMLVLETVRSCTSAQMHCFMSC